MFQCKHELFRSHCSTAAPFMGLQTSQVRRPFSFLLESSMNVIKAGHFAACYHNRYYGSMEQSREVNFFADDRSGAGWLGLPPASGSSAHRQESSSSPCLEKASKALGHLQRGAEAARGGSGGETRALWELAPKEESSSDTKI